MRILIAEDDETTRKLLREQLEDTYQIVETSDPTKALTLALQHKPDCILLDLMLPESTGFELCQTLASHSATRLIPILALTAKPAADYKDWCLNLGATDYFVKPINFAQLKTRLREVLSRKPAERRLVVRVVLNAILKLSGTDAHGVRFELPTLADNVSTTGFLCSCSRPLGKDAIVSVSLMGKQERFVGRARRVRTQWRGKPWQRCGFQFVDKPLDWIVD
jgi:DNA-binding response OmpR family regulator